MSLEQFAHLSRGERHPSPLDADVDDAFAVRGDLAEAVTVEVDDPALDVRAAAGDLARDRPSVVDVGDPEDRPDRSAVVGAAPGRAVVVAGLAGLRTGRRRFGRGRAAG